MLAGAAALAAEWVVSDTVAVIKEKSPFLFPLLAHSWQICSFPPFLSALRDRRLFVYRFGVIFGDFPRCMPLEKSAWYYRRG